MHASWKKENSKEILGNFFPSECCQILEQGPQEVVKLHPWRYLRLNQTMPEQPDLNWSCLEVGLNQRSPEVPSNLKLFYDSINYFAPQWSKLCVHPKMNYRYSK